MRASRACVSRFLRDAAAVVDRPSRVQDYAVYLHRRGWNDEPLPRNTRFERTRRTLTYTGGSMGVLVGLALSASNGLWFFPAGLTLACLGCAAGATSGRYAHYTVPLVVVVAALGVTHRLMQKYYGDVQKADNYTPGMHDHY